MDRAADRDAGVDRAAPQAGTALFMLIVILTLLLGLVAISFASFSRAHARAGENEKAFVSARYLAEGGLAALKWEIVEDADLEADGVGFHDRSTAAGSTVAEATLLAPDRYELVSTGTVDDVSVTLAETALVVRGGLPDGALSVVGGSAAIQVLPSSSTQLVIDGGADSPAVVLTDPGFHSAFVSGIEGGISAGYVAGESITGNGLEGTDAIAAGTTPADFSGLHDGIRDRIAESILPAAIPTSLPGSSGISYGTPAAPQVRRFPPGQKLTSGQTLWGNGTLVFDRDLVIEPGASLVWDGDIIIHGDAANDALLEIGGSLEATGNVVVVSGGNRDATLLVKSTGEVDIDGAITAATDSGIPNTKLQFLVEGELSLRGVLTTSASVHQTEFKPGCDALIEGLAQLAMPVGAAALSMQFKIDGALELLRDTAACEAALADLERVGAGLGLGSGSGSMRLESFGWRVVH